MRHLAFSALAICSLMVFDDRCAQEPAGAKAKPAQPKTVAEICQDPARYADQVVALKGLFQGFRIADCHFPEAASRTGLTRRDWLFRTGDDCLYVTGGAPRDIDPLDEAFVGRRLELTARVSRTEAGKLYLKYVEASPLIGTPSK